LDDSLVEKVRNRLDDFESGDEIDEKLLDALDSPDQMREILRELDEEYEERFDEALNTFEN
jgi:hypothetical protein